MKNKKVLVIVCSLVFVFLSCNAFAWDINDLFGGKSSSNANNPEGSQAKPSQTAVKADGGGDGGGTNRSESIISKPLAGSLSAGGGVDTSYIGTWVRQALYINGKLEHRTPATLVYKKNSFTAATGVCSTAGTIAVSANTIKTVMTQTNCPGGVKVPMTIVYSYEITDNNKKLILMAGPVKEVYTR